MAKPEKNQTENNAVETTDRQEAADGFDMKFIGIITLKLFLICTITASLLAGVNALTADRIEENLEREKTNAIAAIFPSADENQKLEELPEGVAGLYLVLSDGDLLGYAAEVTPLGFGGDMNIMVGVNADGTVAGIKIVSHSETPGLGNRVEDADYLSQYTGKTGPLTLGDKIDAITGSTVSSKAVLDGVNTALNAYSSIFTENDVIAGGAE